MSTSVSVLICTRNRASSLAPTLRSLASVSIPPGWAFELVLVDNGSTDDTPNLISNFSRQTSLSLVSLSQPIQGKSRALNLGMARARGEIFLFSDDDLRFPANWLTNMCQPIITGDRDVVQGGIRWAPHLESKLDHSGQYLPKFITSTRHKSSVELSDGLIGANMAFSRQVYNQVGNFNEELGPGALGLGEETLYGWKCARMGFKRVNRLDIEVEHHFDASRLTFSGILDLAKRKGQSGGYLDYHYHNVSVRYTTSRLYFAMLKDKLRSLPLRPGKHHLFPPQWKYSYTATIYRLRQILVESQRPRLHL